MFFVIIIIILVLVAVAVLLLFLLFVNTKSLANNISSLGVKSLGSSIFRNKTVVRLVLSMNKFGSIGLKELCLGLLFRF